MFYVLHGEDEFTSREQLKKLRQQGNFDFNQDVYSGAEADVKTILMACDTLPFLTEQRLVVVVGLPKKKRGETAQAASETSSNAPVPSAKMKKGKKGSRGHALTRAGFVKELAEYVPSMPETTVLILIVDEVLEASNPLIRVAEQHGKVLHHAQPKGAALEAWITKRAKNIGVGITPDAVSLLANFIGSNLRLLANELDKLAIYVGKGATITPGDIRLLSAHVQEARIFDLTDALAQRKHKQALHVLHDLLADGEPPLKLISTIISQVRSLLLIKELMQKGMRAGQIATTLGIAPFIVTKSLRQVNNFSVAQLEDIYRYLLTTDAALKRSRLSPELALDLLVLQFCS